MARKMGKKNKGIVDEKVLLMRTMTKKQYQEYQKKQRSTVTNGMNTGTITMGTVKDGSKKAKRCKDEPSMQGNEVLLHKSNLLY